MSYTEVIRSGLEFSESRDLLAPALVKMQVMAKNPRLDGKGFNYSYATLPPILSMVKKIQERCGLFILVAKTHTEHRQPDDVQATAVDSLAEILKGENGVALLRDGMGMTQGRKGWGNAVDTYLSSVTRGLNQAVTHFTVLVLHESGQYMSYTASLSLPREDTVNEAQADGMGITYGRRYVYCDLFGISGDKDSDGTVEYYYGDDSACSKIHEGAFVQYMKAEGSIPESQEALGEWYKSKKESK